MLIYSEKRLVPTDVNMIVLKGKESGYFYVHRALYDQAVILNDIYKDDIPRLIEAITGSQNGRDDVWTFLDTAPTPINILAPFLLLVNDELTEFNDMVGAIHVMSGPVNLRGMLRYPMDMRNTPTFSLSIREEYELAWNRFFMTTMEYNEQMAQLASQTFVPMNGTATYTQEMPEDTSFTAVSDVATEDADDPYAGVDPACIGEDGNVYDSPIEAIMYGALPRDFGAKSDDEEEEKAAKEAAPEDNNNGVSIEDALAAITGVQPVAPAAPSQAPAPAPAPQKQDGLSVLSNLV